MLKLSISELADRRFNRNIMGCKDVLTIRDMNGVEDLIGT